MTDRIHQDQPVEAEGEELEDASVAVLMLHGRGASAASILTLAGELGVSGVAYVAPRAAGRTWYPNPFTATVESNQPHLDAALEMIDERIETIEAAGIDRESVVLLGFSQGACLAAEFAARNPRRYGGLAVLSGGLIGPSTSTDDYEGDLDGTPALLGCSDRDPHIPLERVEVTADVLEGLGAVVDKRIYEGMGHTIDEDELDAIESMLESLVEAA